MKLCRAAALTLVSWYLIIPHPGSPLPFSRWIRVQTFNSADECQQALILDRKNYENETAQLWNGTRWIGPWPPTYGQVDTVTVDLAFQWAQCIATDDPRLNE
jgi:hypothetical protein